MSFSVRKDDYYNSLRITNKLLRVPVVTNLDEAVATKGSFVLDLSTNNICVYSGTEWICDNGTGNNNCIQEATEDNGVVIEKPLFLNRHGIGRVILGEPIFIDDDSSITILSPESFDLSFSSIGVVGDGGPALLLTDTDSDYIFKAPLAEDYNNECLQDYTKMFLKVDFQGTLFDEIPFSSGLIYLNVLINGDDTAIYIITENTISYNDILELSPGDEVGFGIYIDRIADSNILVKDQTFINFTILGFQ